MEQLQVVIESGEAGYLIAGLTAAARSARLARAELAASVVKKIDPQSRLLVISNGGFPEPGALARFQEEAARSGEPARWFFDGRAVATYYPQAAIFLSGPKSGGSIRDYRPQGKAWWPTLDARSAAEAEEALFARLPRESDGYLARFDRRLSIALSRRLVRTPVTPNAITTASLLIGLYGAWELAFGSYWGQVLGAFFLWSCCILDGSDGEVARLKLMASKAGGIYDVLVDNIVHLAIFAAIPVAIGRDHPGASMAVPGVVLLSGVLACLFSVWYVVLRLPQEKRGKAGLMVERLASRDFIYLILILTVIRRLEWFLWAAGIGSHLFNLALWAGFFLRRRA